MLVADNQSYREAWKTTIYRIRPPAPGHTGDALEETQPVARKKEYAKLFLVSKLPDTCGSVKAASEPIDFADSESGASDRHAVTVIAADKLRPNVLRRTSSQTQFCPSPELVRLFLVHGVSSGGVSQDGAAGLEALDPTLRAKLRIEGLLGNLAHRALARGSFRVRLSNGERFDAQFSQDFVYYFGLDVFYSREILTRLHDELASFVRGVPCEFGWGILFYDDGLVIEPAASIATVPLDEVEAELWHAV